MLRKPGLFTSGDRLAVRLVGPSTPATKRGRPACCPLIGDFAGQPGRFPVQLGTRLSMP
jgi:hypothetical protein